MAGCGGSDSSGSADAGDDADGSAGGPPTDASVEDFCGTFLDLIEQASQQGSDVSDADAVELAKEAADKLSEVGTPEDMPADARRAFEKAIEQIRSIPDGATQKEMDDIAADLTAEQQQDLQALTAYVTEKCMGQLAPVTCPATGPVGRGPESDSGSNSDSPGNRRASRGYFNSRDSRRSASGLPPVWQVGQYCSEESANDTSRTVSPQTGHFSPVRPWTARLDFFSPLSSLAASPRDRSTASPSTPRMAS